MTNNSPAYTAAQILDEEYGDDVTVVQGGKVTGRWRWGTTHQTVVKIGDELWAVNYRIQPEEGLQDHGELYRVVAKERVVVDYVGGGVMKLTDVGFDDIMVGDKVRSSVTGAIGTIALFDPSEEGRRRGYVKINWDNGRKSHADIFLNGVPWLDRVEYIGRE